MTRNERARQYGDAVAEWMRTGDADAADNLAEIENDLCGYLDIPLDETEQGLTPVAQSIIDEFLTSEGVEVR